MRARDIFDGSDAALTRAYNCDLRRAGERGALAVALLKAQKASFRAKRYRGGPTTGVRSYSTMAYENKAKALGELCALLESRPELVPAWGWKLDPSQTHAAWVLYVELPDKVGQVSFHNIARLRGPNFAGEWDKRHTSVERILQFCDSIMDSLTGAQATFDTGFEIPF